MNQSGINIQQIDNGFLVAFPQGEPIIQGNQQQQRIVIHFCEDWAAVVNYLKEMDK